MDVYYRKKKVIGRAWSVMACMSGEDHPPHTWSGEYTIYGPYCCPGLPRKKIRHLCQVCKGKVKV